MAYQQWIQEATEDGTHTHTCTTCCPRPSSVLSFIVINPLEKIVLAKMLKAARIEDSRIKKVSDAGML